jgi:hypothetical protein
MKSSSYRKQFCVVGFVINICLLVWGIAYLTGDYLYYFLFVVVTPLSGFLAFVLFKALDRPI